ncbi:hypothetical protein YQE_06159, partial [Dendroctonus ponderosae]
FINPVENRLVSFFAIGEGWHNYHHTFPWDYKAAEFGRINLSLTIINLFAKIGWAYDLKTVSKEMIEKRVTRTGDGSHEIWGWGDKDQTKENYESADCFVDLRAKGCRGCAGTAASRDPTVLTSRGPFRCGSHRLGLLVRPREKQPLPSLPTGPLNECDDIVTDKIPQDTYEPDDRPIDIVWRNVVVFVILHSVALYGLYLCFISAMWTTTIYGILLYQMSAFGITGGAHRLWAHRSYKAKWPLKVILLICQTLAHQNSVIEWSRDHRVHHKFQETDADPHNAKRGFFFSHMGWLLCKKHQEVKNKGKGVDMSDLYAEPLLRLQHKYFLVLMPIVCFVLPTIIPMLLWNETFMNAYCVNILRYICALHATWLVNSAAHMWGSKPYD